MRKFLKSKEKYIDSLGKLFDYATKVFEKRIMSRFVDGSCQYTYGQFREKCEDLSRTLCRYGVSAGDKVAIYSQSMPNWTVALFSLLPFGRIAIPILPDCSSNEVKNILAHSSSKVLFVSSRLLPKVPQECIENMALVIETDSLTIIHKNDSAFTCDGKASVPLPDDIATIIYTSGTTGNSKGVILSHRNFVSNVISCSYAQPTHKRDIWLSILPMAHTYELTLGVFYPMYSGARVEYIKKIPSPAVLLPALKKVRPTIMLSVPMVIEKIYKNSIIPTINKSAFLKWMEKNAYWLLCKIIGMKLKSTFGGRLKFFGVGGAKLDIDVERFLLKAGFPYAIGYGLTETSPLICQCVGKIRNPGSTGQPARGVEVKLLDPDPETGEGELVTKSPCVMMGYYKDPDRTRKVFTEDGWFRTNDRASVDKKGRYYIKGRVDNMIIGSSGENIYPEEIEKVINDIDNVNESVVMENNGKLVAIVHINEDFVNWDHEGEAAVLAKLESMKETILKKVNKSVSKASQISKVEVVKEPFEKTATQKIRRFKYKHIAEGKSSESKTKPGENNEK